LNIEGLEFEEGCPEFTVILPAFPK